MYTDTEQGILKIVKGSEVMVWLEKTKDTPEGAYKAVVISLAVRMATKKLEDRVNPVKGFGPNR